MRRAVLYLRVSTLDQTTANQERELREIAGRMGCEIVRVYKDHGISGTMGRDQRPAIREALATPGRPGVRVIAKQFGVNPGTVQRISRPFEQDAVAL
jgi:predicted site-specific integrase-resolvase